MSIADNTAKPLMANAMNAAHNGCANASPSFAFAAAWSGIVAPTRTLIANKIH